MIRRLSAALLVSSFALSACSLSPAPRPNEALLGLAEHALDDASALRQSQSPEADLRAQQAEALFAEVRRLCGTTKEGSTPDSCIVPTRDATPTADTSDVLGRAQQELLDKVGEIPAESMPRVAVINAQLATLRDSGAESTVPDAPQPAPEAANRMLEWEYATVYGLKVALAYAGSATDEVERAIEAHQSLAANLHTAISNTKGMDPVAAAPSYDLNAYPKPEDAASVREFLTDIESDTAQRWNIAATESKDAQWRKFALINAGNAATRATPGLKARGEDPLTAEFAVLR